MRNCTLALFAVVLATTGLQAEAQSGFNGTWRYNAGKTQPTTDPIRLELKDGVYRCASCDPVFSVLVDGAEHDDSADPAFDTVTASLASEGTLRVVRKKAGKVGRETAIAASSDGKFLTMDSTRYPESDAEPIRLVTRMKRLGTAPSGLHAINGEWLIERWEPGSEREDTFTMDVTNDRVKLESQAGEGYEANFDEKEYPVSGSRGFGKVRVNRVSPTVLEETSLYAGKVVSVSRFVLSPDGRTLNITITEPGVKTPTIAIYEKQ